MLGRVRHHFSGSLSFHLGASLVVLGLVILSNQSFVGTIFRHMAGLEEMLIPRDAIAVKKQMLRSLHPERAKVLRKAIAKF
jgi:hypothetical protein